MKLLQATYVRGIAGSEKFLLSAIPGLKRKGYDVEVLILYVVENETASFRKELEQLDIGYHEIRIAGSHLISNLRAVGRLMRQFDVCNSHLLHADLVLSLAKRFFARKTVLVSGKHGYEEWYNNRFGFDPAHKVKNKYWRTARFAEQKINKAFAISKGLQRLYTGLGICRNDNVELIYYGFDFDTLLEENKALRMGYPQLCIVGRLTEFKGHRYALETVSLLKPTYPDVQLIVIGWGELEATLKEQTEQLGIADNVIFKGFQPNPREYMLASDIVLIPSVAEGFGIVIAEAMSVMRPIVAFDVPSPNELLENEYSALLVPPYQTHKMAEAVSRILADEPLKNKLGMNALKVLEETYSYERMITQLDVFYQSSLSKS